MTDINRSLPNAPSSSTNSGPTHNTTASKRLTPQSIPKTIIFVDGRIKVAAIANCLKEWLIQKGYSCPLAHKTIEVYTSQVPKFDQDRIYTEFKKEQSVIHILVAMTALGMGMDIPDVEFVLQWGFPLTKDISDLWQRFGRAARAQGKKGIAVLLVPYWAFDNLGYYQDVSITQMASHVVPVQHAR